MATKTILTDEEFARLPEPLSGSYELVEGELVFVSPTAPLHNRVRDRILLLLKPFVEGQNLGMVWAEQAFHLAAGLTRIPDVAFVQANRPIDVRAIPEGAPDLAIEVYSPTNTPQERDRKTSEYLAAGARRVWIVYPEEHEVYVQGREGIRRYHGSDILEDPELLPGFSTPVSQFFQ